MRSAGASLIQVAVLLALHCVRGGWSQFGGEFGGSCNYEIEQCMQDIDDNEHVLPILNNSVRCPLLQDALNCLENLDCQDIFVVIAITQLKDYMEEFGCHASLVPTPTPAATTSEQLTPTPSPTSCPSHPLTLPCDSPLGSCCPQLPPILPDDCDLVFQHLGMPQLKPLTAPRECVVPEPDLVTLQHCSMFTYSHVRPFGTYELGIQTCSLPGSWYLLKHPGFSVEVETAGEDIGSPHTLLRKVNVTFFNHSCSKGRSYIAESNTLSYTFSDGLASTSALQLRIDNDTTSASILATWLNVSVVIRSYSQYLSVTIQLPGKFIFDSEGLCNGGCPDHSIVDATAYTTSQAEECVEDNQRAGHHCFAAGILNANTDVFYGESCMFDTIKAGSLQVLSMINATVRDALLLPDVGLVPSPEPPSPLQPPLTEPPATVLTPPDPTATEDPTVRTDPSTPPPSSQTPLYPSLHFISVVVTLAVAVLLR